MNHKYVEGTVVALIVVYVLIVMVNIVLDDSSFNESEAISTTLDALRYVELGILGVFMLEIVFKVWGSGIKVSNLMFILLMFSGLF